MPTAPRLDDVRTVLRYAPDLLADAEDLDTLLATLQVTSGVTPRDDVVVTPAGRAASRFVLDALTDALVDRLRDGRERH